MEILNTIVHLKNLFIRHLEPVQYNTALSIPGTIKGSSKEKLHQELDLELLKSR